MKPIWNSEEEQRRAASALDLMFGAMAGGILGTLVSDHPMLFAWAGAAAAWLFIFGNVALVSTTPYRRQFRAVCLVGALVLMLLAIWLPWRAASGGAAAGILFGSLAAWMVASVWIKGSKVREDSGSVVPAPANTDADTPLARHHPYLARVAALLAVLCYCMVFANLWPNFAAGRWAAYVWEGGGVYDVALLLATLTLAAVGLRLSFRGRCEAKRSTRLERDHRWIQRYGGDLLTLTGAAVALAAFWMSQAPAAHVAGTPPVSEGAGRLNSIGFFDLMTWLGTFGTLAVVVSGALVAMYVKRRDDETQHSSSVMLMRQAWIEALRAQLSSLIAAGEQLYKAAEKNGLADVARADEVNRLLREVQLRLNPTEGHHVVLTHGLKGWLHAANLSEQLSGRNPPLLWNATVFEAGREWLVAAGQLVLKIEWTVTSRDSSRLEEKAGGLWRAILESEQTNKDILDQIVPTAMYHRSIVAKTLIEGTRTSHPDGAGVLQSAPGSPVTSDSPEPAE